MRLTLIGMSGVGKTAWAKKLEKKGFTRYTVDEFIEDKLHDELKKFGYKGIQDVSKWMGQPYHERYKKTSKRYLELERRSLKEIIKLIKKTTDEKIVIDTTGSVIYIDDEILNQLFDLTTVVYLETSPEQVEAMKQKYFQDPKPVIWGEIFDLRSDETSEGALRRCYSELLKFRSNKYSQYSHLTIKDKLLYQGKFNTQKLLEYIHKFKN